MDSKLVVEQMSGRWKVKNAALQPLVAKARELASRFGEVRYEWIPRAQNAHADRLANEAMDTQAGKQGNPRTSSPARWTGARGKPTRMMLLRHGQTALSIDRRYSGRRDVPLTEHGAQQAAAAAKRLAGMPGVVVDGEPAPIISSPLTRAKQTAQAVADAIGGRVETHPGLVETDFGEWEGLTFAEAAERDRESHARWIGDTTVAPPGGESFEQAERRVARARAELVEAHPGRTIVVVSHVTPIKSLLRQALDAGPSVLYRLHLELASLSIVEFYPDGNASVRVTNDVCHLG